jgi:cysteine desulfurase
MMVNNEAGSVMPIAQMAKLTHKVCPNAIFHTDAVQGFLKIPFAAKTLGADLISISSHKVHGPKGAGALYISPKLKSFPALLIGGGQESNFRSGTEGTPAIFGFAAACEAVSKTFKADAIHEKELLDRFVEKVSALEGIRINGAHEAPHNVSLSIPGVPTQNTINILQDHGICVSAGSACAKGHRSHVLTAMKVPEKAMDGSFRVSLCRDTTREELDKLFSDATGFPDITPSLLRKSEGERPVVRRMSEAKNFTSLYPTAAEISASDILVEVRRRHPCITR